MLIAPLSIPNSSRRRPEKIHFRQRVEYNRNLRKLKTYLGRVIRDIERRIVGNEDLRQAFVRPLFLARRVLEQERRQRVHAPEIECIGKGKAHDLTNSASR
jgi:IS5 family transposase